MPKPTDVEKQKYMFTDDIKFFQKAVIFHPDKNELFLALKRPANAFQRPNDWDLAGGNVLFGELHEDSLRREILEEANVKAGIFTPVQIITTYDGEKEMYYIFTGFCCRAEKSDVKISSEHSEYRWVTKEEFLDLKPAQFLVDLVLAVFEKV
jgi:8-oxo-dGTP diphosphatase